MKFIAEKTWRVPNDMRRLMETAAEVGDWLEGFGLAERVSYTAHLAVEEMGSNIIKYGYEGGEHTIHVSVFVGAEAVRVRLEDDGKPFDPFARPELDLEATLAEDGEGGVGIELIRKVCQRVAYERAGDRNVVEMDLPKQMEGDEEEDGLT